MSQYKTPTSSLDKLDIPQELKNAYSLDFSKARYLEPIEMDLSNLQRIYQETNDFYQTYIKEIPEDQGHSSNFLMGKTQQMKNLEEMLFSNIRRTSYLTIDSRDRDHDRDEANNYRIYLQHPLRNVYSLELVSAEVPKSTYIVNEFNNIIHFQETNSQVATTSYYEAIVPNGNYDILELLPLIQSAMNAVGNSSYIVSLVSNRVKITSDLTGGDNIFRLDFSSDDSNNRYKTNSLGRQLGFHPLYKTGTFAYTAESLYDLSYNHYAILTFPNLNNEVFQKIPLNNDMVYFSKDIDFIYKHEFYPPIEIDYLNVRWTDIDGNLVNFHGLPHSFTIKIEMFS